ncbi:MAG: phosphate signaling complex protein PhoU [Acidobacteriota bacterium]
MPRHLHRDLERLNRELTNIGALVEDATNKAILALIDRRAELAREVIAGDKQIDAREVQLEEDCLKNLALHQPVATDLRVVVTIMKVNNDLERVGDLAGNIAERALDLAGKPTITIPKEIEEMTAWVRTMLRDCLHAVIELDVQLAHKVLRDDAEVDGRHQQIYGIMREAMQAEPDRIGDFMQLVTVSRCLERIADLATNIAEDVIFVVEGEVVRHQFS